MSRMKFTTLLTSVSVTSHSSHEPQQAPCCSSIIPLRSSYYSSLGHFSILPDDDIILFPLSNPLPSANGLIFCRTANSGALGRELWCSTTYPPTASVLLQPALLPVALQSGLWSKPSPCILTHWTPSPLSRRADHSVLPETLSSLGFQNLSWFSSPLSDYFPSLLYWCLLIALASKIDRSQGSAPGPLPSSSYIHLPVLAHGF